MISRARLRDYANRPNKASARAWMFGDIPQRKSVLTLPSQQLGCVEHMVKHKIIGPSTRQQWVEHNQRIAKLLALRLAKHTHLHTGELEDYDPIAMVDLANLDMECSFSERLGLWIEHQLSPKLMPKSYVILTVMAFGRNNEFLETWLPQQLRQGLLQDELHQLKLTSGCLNEDKLIPFALLRSALHRFDAHRIRSAGYRDQSDMLTVSFYVGDRVPASVIPFSKIVAEYRKAPISIDRSRKNGEPVGLFATVVRTLASLNFSMTPDEDGKWFIHNHDRATTTLPVPLTLEQIVQFFQIQTEKDTSDA